MIEIAALWVIPLGIIAALLAAVETGYRFGLRRMRTFPADQKIDTGAIQGAMLGVLGMLLGFSFAGAASRFIERQDLIDREANAIGTAYLRADLLNKDDAAELKAALLSYLDHRLVIARSVQFALSPEYAKKASADHARIWAAACKGIENKPATINIVVGAVTEVLDLHDFRVAAGRKHLPGLVLTLLSICSVLTLSVMGYASALGRHRNTLMISVIAILISAALWTTIDMDWTRIGLVRVSDQALYDLHNSISDTAPQ